MVQNNQRVEKEVKAIEKQISGLRNKLKRLRRQASKLQVQDYAFKDFESREVRLSELFGDKRDLIVIHNMGKHCPYCTMWADGFNGVVKHLEDRAAFVVISPDAPDVQREFAKSRGWNFKMLSAEGTAFIKDMGFEGVRGWRYGQYVPGVSSFQKEKGGKMVRISKAVFGPGDDFCAVWHLLDLLATGSGGWEPKFSYKAQPESAQSSERDLVQA